MRYVVKEDGCGMKRVYLVRDQDSDEEADFIGVPAGPPVPFVDLEQVAIDINNLLVERGLFTWDDVVQTQGALSSAINLVVKRHLQALYREMA